MSVTEIWIAEDDADDIELYRHVLNTYETHYPVQFFTDGASLIQAIRAMEPVRRCLIIVDGYLPKMNGADVVKMMYAENTLCRHEVAMLTGSISSSAQDMVKQYGIHVLEKPTSINELRDIFRMLLNH